MRKPYRVVVWGVGGVGGACLRQALSREHDVEVVGALVYSPNKDGKDVGDLVGMRRTGVKATRDKQAILNLEADCVLHCARPPFEEESMHQDVIGLLASGKNVISAVAYHYPPFHGPEYVERLEAACRKGGTSLLGSGENPGFMYERLGLTMAALCNDIQHIRLQEISDVSRADAAFMRVIGFGVPPDKIDRGTGPLAELWKKYYYREMLTAICLSLFERTPEKIEHQDHYQPAKKRIQVRDHVIEPGTTEYIRHIFTAYVDGKPKVAAEFHWYLVPESYPEPVPSPEFWRLEIEGRPISVRCEVNLSNSLIPEQSDHKLYMMYEASAAAMIRSMPLVCSAAPGIFYPSVFAGYTPDLRSLPIRRNIVG